MTDWRDFERRCAKLIAGKRYEANTGHDADVESDDLVGQCKERQQMSLAEISATVMQVTQAAKAKGKTGVCFIRLKSGRGVKTPILAIVDATDWWAS